jgi:DNA-binding response OmpR family regulator
MDNKRIYLVDDSKEFSLLINSLLKFHNLELISETDATKVEETIEKEIFDIYIFDYMMEVSGFKLAEKVRARKKTKNAKIILLTAKKLNEEELMELNKLKIIYLMKPVMPNDFYNKIMELLDD